jgi:hypothetical protein
MERGISEEKIDLLIKELEQISNGLDQMLSLASEIPECSKYIDKFFGPD